MSFCPIASALKMNSPNAVSSLLEMFEWLFLSAIIRSKIRASCPANLFFSNNHFRQWDIDLGLASIPSLASHSTVFAAECLFKYSKRASCFSSLSFFNTAWLGPFLGFISMTSQSVLIDIPDPLFRNSPRPVFPVDFRSRLLHQRRRPVPQVIQRLRHFLLR